MTQCAATNPTRGSTATGPIPPIPKSVWTTHYGFELVQGVGKEAILVHDDYGPVSRIEPGEGVCLYQDTIAGRQVTGNGTDIKVGGRARIWGSPDVNNNNNKFVPYPRCAYPPPGF